jgi:hypothetical protein
MDITVNLPDETSVVLKVCFILFILEEIKKIDTNLVTNKCHG